MTLQLVALSPTELQPAQAALLEWCDGRLAHWLAEQTEAREAYQYAVKHRWAPGRFRLSMNKAGRKLGFYRKVRRALELGYLIVPNAAGIHCDPNRRAGGCLRPHSRGRRLERQAGDVFSRVVLRPRAALT